MRKNGPLGVPLACQWVVSPMGGMAGTFTGFCHWQPQWAQWQPFEHLYDLDGVATGWRRQWGRWQPRTLIGPRGGREGNGRGGETNLEEGDEQGHHLRQLGGHPLAGREEPLGEFGVRLGGVSLWRNWELM